MTIYWVSAQEDTSRDSEPNWCYEGEEWGDGRCNHPDPDINDYNWRVGWLFAQCDSGNLPREACYQTVESENNEALVFENESELPSICYFSIRVTGTSSEEEFFCNGTIIE